MSALLGRAVLITGGNGGISRGSAAAVGAAGAQVVIWGRDADKNDTALQRLFVQGTRAPALKCDIGQEREVERGFARSLQLCGGRIDAVFANAGRICSGADALEVSLAEWRAVMTTNLDGAFLTLRTAARHMVEAGGGSRVAFHQRLRFTERCATSRTRYR